MARVLFATVPIAGHIQPFLAVARALVARGHDVRWYTGQKYGPLVARTGARFEPYRAAPEFDDHDMDAAFPARRNARGLAQLKFDLVHVFGAAMPGQLRDLEQIAGRFSPDVLIADPCLLGALLFKELHRTRLVVINVVANTLSSRDLAPFGLGLAPHPWLGRFATSALKLATRRLILRGLQTEWVRARHSLGLATPMFLTDAPIVADLFLLPTIESFEYPRSDLPAHVRFVGALHGDPPAQLADLSFLQQLDPTRPLVHVTQGTMSNAAPTLIGPTLAALAEEPVHVVVATGGRSAAELGLARLPPNAHLVPCLSYPALLPRTSVMITNGGYGGVQLALSYGVPLVVWGTTEDKPETAARIAWTGAGLRLRGRAPKPRAIRAAVRTVLSDARYRQRARELAREYQEHRPVEVVVALIESLLFGETV